MLDRLSSISESSSWRLPLGVQYRRSGRQNISIGRNIALETGCEYGDVLVMTDDDCVPELTWIDRLLDTHERMGAESVSGPLVLDLPDDAPSWIREQQVFDFDHPPIPEGTVLDIGQTNNSLLDVSWLRSHPQPRDPEFGRTGGEDMMFLHGAIRLGMRSVHSAEARVHQHEPLDDLTYRAMFRARYWWGNSEAVTTVSSFNASRPRVFIRGGKRMLLAFAMPVRRLGGRRAPHSRSLPWPVPRRRE